MHHGTVSCADRLSQGVIAWPQVRRIPMKTSKKSRKKKKTPKNRRLRRAMDPISPPHGHPLGPPRRPRVLPLSRRSPLPRSATPPPPAAPLFSRTSASRCCLSRRRRLGSTTPTQTRTCICPSNTAPTPPSSALWGPSSTLRGSVPDHTFRRPRPRRRARHTRREGGIPKVRPHRRARRRGMAE